MTGTGEIASGGSAPETQGETFHPMGFGDVLEHVFKISWNNAKAFILIVLILALPGYLILLGSFAAFPWDLVPIPQTGETLVKGPSYDPPLARFAPFGVLLLIGILVAWIGGAASFVAGLSVAHGARAGRPVDWKGAIRLGLRRTPSMIWVTIVEIVAVIAILGFILAPGIVAVALEQDWWSILIVIFLSLVALTIVGWLWLMWVLAPATLVTEPVRGTKAMRRSFQLVKGKVMWITAVLLVAMVAASVLGSLFTLPAAFVAPAAPTNVPLLLGVYVIGTLLSMFVYFPLQVVTIALLYLDARVRKEGLTPQQLGTELDGALGRRREPQVS